MIWLIDSLVKKTLVHDAKPFNGYFFDIQNVLWTQVKDQKTQRQLTAAGFLVITQ